MMRICASKPRWGKLILEKVIVDVSDTAQFGKENVGGISFSNFGFLTFYRLPNTNMGKSNFKKSVWPEENTISKFALK